MGLRAIVQKKYAKRKNLDHHIKVQSGLGRGFIFFKMMFYKHISLQNLEIGKIIE